MALLTADEQTALRDLSVFRGGFDRAAVQSMGRPAPAVVSRLINKSLLREDHSGRLDLHRLIGQYAEEQLIVSGTADQAHARHAAWCVSLAEMAEPQLIGQTQADWLTRLAVEQGNFRAAITWALATEPMTTLALRLCAALWRFWWLHGHVSEGRYWLDRL